VPIASETMAMEALKMKEIFITLVTAAFVVGCAHSASARPDWILGKETTKYPSNRFLVGMGQSEELSKAQDRARAEIAKFFSVKVEQEVKSVQKTSDSDGPKGKSWLSSTAINETMKTTVTGTLQGVEIKETWQDPVLKNYYVLAVLPRAPVESRLTEELMDLDSKIKSAISKSDGASDKILKIKWMVRAYDLYQQRRLVNNQLSVVSLDGEGIKPSPEIAGVNDKLTDMLGKITVSVDIKGDLSGPISEAIISSLNNGHISVTPGGIDTDILITGKTELKPTDESNSIGFVFARGRAFVSIINRADGKTFGSVEKEDREGAKDMQGAKSSVISQLKDEIINDFNEKFRSALSLGDGLR